MTTMDWIGLGAMLFLLGIFIIAMRKRSKAYNEYLKRRGGGK